MQYYFQATSEVIGRILERDAKVKKMILDIYYSVLTTLKKIENVRGLESSMHIATVEGYIKQLERKQYPIVVAGKIDGMESCNN